MPGLACVLRGGHMPCRLLLPPRRCTSAAAPRRTRWCMLPRLLLRCMWSPPQTTPYRRLRPLLLPAILITQRLLLLPRKCWWLGSLLLPLLLRWLTCLLLPLLLLGLLVMLARRLPSLLPVAKASARCQTPSRAAVAALITPSASVLLVAALLLLRLPLPLAATARLTPATLLLATCRALRGGDRPAVIFLRKAECSAIVTRMDQPTVHPEQPPGCLILVMACRRHGPAPTSSSCPWNACQRCGGCCCRSSACSHSSSAQPPPSSSCR